MPPSISYLPLTAGPVVNCSCTPLALRRLLQDKKACMNNFGLHVVQLSLADPAHSHGLILTDNIPIPSALSLTSNGHHAIM